MQKKEKIFLGLSFIFGLGAVFTWIFAEWADHFDILVFGRNALHFFWDSTTGLLFAIWFLLIAFYLKSRTELNK